MYFANYIYCSRYTYGLYFLFGDILNLRGIFYHSIFVQTFCQLKTNQLLGSESFVCKPHLFLTPSFCAIYKCLLQLHMLCKQFISIKFILLSFFWCTNVSLQERCEKLSSYCQSICVLIYFLRNYKQITLHAFQYLQNIARNFK